LKEIKGSNHVLSVTIRVVK